jgi:hypothetical protein
MWHGAIAAPPGRAQVWMTIELAHDRSAAERRLELRAHDTGRAFARGPWVSGAPGITPGSTNWGRLRSHLAGGGVEALIVDRAGQILRREVLDPALAGAPMLGLESARRRWAAVVGNREQHCPEGTTPMQEIVVT